MNFHPQKILSQKIFGVLFVLTLMVGTTAVLAQAQTSYTPLAPLPCVPSKGNTNCTTSGGTYSSGSAVTKVDFQGYVQNVFNVIIAVGAAAAVFIIVLGGLQYMTTDSWTGKKSGLDKVKNALLGLLLVVTSFILLRTIDPRLVSIPSTLVTPLKIASTNTTSGLLGTLGADADKYLITNTQAKANIDAANKNITDLNAKKASTEAGLLNYADKAGYINSTVASLCAEQGFTAPAQRDPTIVNACNELIKIDDDIKINKADVYTQAAQAVMAGQATDCLKKGGTLDSCAAIIEQARSKAASEVVGIGQSPQQINDNAAYSTAMLKILGSVDKYNPTIGLLLNASQNINALIPGGGIANDIQNWILPNSVNGCGTAKDVQAAANSAKIQNAEMKAELVNQANAISKKLGC